jgi:hypothetical protein
MRLTERCSFHTGSYKKICTQKKGRLRCHKRPKSREETPKEGNDSGGYRIPLAKTIAISGSIGRKGSRTDTKVYGARP